MRNDFEAFKRVLREFKGLSVSIVGGSMAVPFAASAVSLAPPWPKGIVVATGFVELLALVLSYQFLEGASRRKVNIVMLVSAIAAIGLSLIYLMSVSRFVYEAGPKHVLSAKGFICNEIGRAMFGTNCPDIDMRFLEQAEGEATAVWTKWSIRLVQWGLMLLWSGAFGALTVFLSSFIIIQTQVRKIRRV